MVISSGPGRDDHALATSLPACNSQAIHFYSYHVAFVSSGATTTTSMDGIGRRPEGSQCYAYLCSENVCKSFEVLQQQLYDVLHSTTDEIYCLQVTAVQNDLH